MSAGLRDRTGRGCETPALCLASPAPGLAFLCLMLVLALGQGCGAGPAYTQGTKAEKQGEPQVAYEDFCQAARKSPGNGGVSAGIKRTAPAAASYWQTQAWRAMTEQRYADAWRLLMKVLEIRPNDTTTSTLILQIQAQHPAEVAEVRADWLRRGSAALTKGMLPAIASASQPEKPRQAVAKAAPREEKKAPPPPPPLAKNAPRKAPAVESKAVVQPAGPPTVNTPTEPTRIAAAQPPKEQEDRVVVPAEGGQAVDVRPPELPDVVDRSQRSSQTPGEDARSGADKTAAVQGGAAIGPTPQVAARAPQGFLSLRTLSKKDKRFPKEAALIDGIVVKLKGTDDDPEADLDLYDGKKRIKKLRGLKIGASQVFPGHSGIDYRLIVLAIHDKTQTVRVGVQEQPAAAATN